MKQHITVKQLNGLSKEGKEKLRSWWKPLGNDYLYSPTYEMGRKTGKWAIGINCNEWARDWNKKKMQRFEWVRETLPLLSIGQMIEFLGDKWIYKHAGNDKLCDTLWKVVRGVLEEIS